MLQAIEHTPFSDFNFTD